MNKFRLGASIMTGVASPAEQHHQDHWEIEDQSQTTAGIEDVLDHTPQLTLRLDTAGTLGGGERQLCTSQEYSCVGFTKHCGAVHIAAFACIPPE